MPTYHLASVVDDSSMNISHVLRGEEWISSTPKHLMLYKFLGLDPPSFVHLPLIFGKDKAKLSKRHGANSIIEYKESGLLPEAIVNYIALLGWSPRNDKEVLTYKDIIFPQKVQNQGGFSLGSLPNDRDLCRDFPSEYLILPCRLWS